MNSRKSHISSALTLGLAALLVVGCLIAVIGVSYAHYRTEEKDGILFRPAQTSQVYLGSVDANGDFVYEQSQWMQSGAGCYYLPFAVKSSQENQQVSIRLVASLGAWEGNGSPVCLYVDEQPYYASTERIAKGSALYAQFGEGWIFCFLDSSGKELTWEALRSFIEMKLDFYGTANADPSLLQLQVIGKNNYE